MIEPTEVQPETTDPIEPAEPKAKSRKRLAAILGGGVLALAALGVGLAFVFGAFSSPPLTAACKAAVAAQDAYVNNAIAEGYPNDLVSDGMPILFGDRPVLNAVGKVCPGSVLVEGLPS